MSQVIIDHYEQVLARHYSKLAGDFDQACARQLALLSQVGIEATGGEVVDLGAGAGLQALPLARAGCHITAVDLSPTLLEELAQRTRGLPVSIINAELVAFMQAPGQSFSLAVCMGDTLLHLPTPAAVEALFEAVLARLEPGAAFVISFRDLSEARHGLDRFLTLVNEPGLRMRCFLEYFEDRVLVHDFIDELSPDGRFVEHRGVYPKLRLTPAWVEAKLTATGFTDLKSVSVAGLFCLSGRRPKRAPA